METVSKVDGMIGPVAAGAAVSPHSPAAASLHSHRFAVDNGGIRLTGMQASGMHAFNESGCYMREI